MIILRRSGKSATTLTMNDFNFPYVGDSVRFFHVCTDGELNGIVHTCQDDYRQADIISAICAEKSGVHIIASAHMSTHSHFVLWCESMTQAREFSLSYKRDYSHYANLSHRMYKVYCGIPADPKEILDLRHLKNCIAYVLQNPVSAGIVRRPEDYSWSSFEAYFNNENPEAQLVSSLPVRERRRILKTRVDLSCSRLRIRADGSLLLKSYIDYSFVERLFGGRTEFYKCLALTDSVEQESIYVCRRVKYDDNELYAEAAAISKSRFGKTDLALMTKAEKILMLKSLRMKTGASPRRLARVLRLDPKFVMALFGEMPPNIPHEI